MGMLFLILDDGNILVLSNTVHQTGSYRCWEGGTPSSNCQGRPGFACPTSLDPETEVMPGRQSETFGHCCINLILKNLVRKALTNPPVKFQLKHADSSKKTNVKLK